MIRNWLRSTLMAAGALAVVSGSAGAQMFNFGTRGQFTTGSPGTCTTAALLTVTCTDPSPTSSLTLTFTGVAPVAGGFSDNSQVTLGTFTVAGNGEVLNLGTGIVNFTLYIDQVSPTSQTGTTSGWITGTLRRPVGGPNFSDLIWEPTEIVNIGPVSYDLIFREGTAGIVLSAAGNTTIEAVGTVVPEPSTYVLMATGLAGLGFVARRRKAA